MSELLKWECEKCNKVFETLYPGTLKNWKRQHIAKHEDQEETFSVLGDTFIEK